MDKPNGGMLSLINSTWIKRIQAARRSREPFMKTADICMNFFRGSCGFMWDSDFRSRFFSKIPTPRFRVTVAKAFEMVSIVGPALFWDYATRKVNISDRLEVHPEAFGDPNDPMVMEMYQSFIDGMNANRSRDKTRASLMEMYLNYSQREQPYGGLMAQATVAIIDALVTGRGCLWIETYKFPGSDKVYTRGTFDRVSRLFIDPDCTKNDLSDATWIARQHIEPYYDVEKRFGLPDGSLRGAALLSTDEAEQASDKEEWRLHSAKGKTHELIVWYEIWSKAGVGTRTNKGSQELHKRFEEVVGDYAYVCVTKHLDHPLNCNPKILAGDEEDVREAFNWPVPYYADERWPVALLDFYPDPVGPWPIAPIATGLGELIFLNIMMPLIMDRAYDSGRNIIAVLKRAGEDTIRQLKSDDHKLILELNEMAAENINQLISTFSLPNLNGDVIQIIEYVSDSFDKRVGLSEFMYGMSSKVTRVAADVNAKQEATSVRPEHMARCVDAWQSNLAALEMLCAAWNVKGDTVRPKLGDFGAKLWDDLIANEDPEIIFREMKATVEANGSRRPNKARDASNLQNLAQYLLPVLQFRAQQNGDYAPLNGFLEAIAKAQDQDLSGMLVNEDKNPVPPDGMIQAQQVVNDQMAAQASMQPEQVPAQEIPPEVVPQEAMPPEQMIPGMESQLRMNANVPPEMLQQLLGMQGPGVV